jgi:hypothetical protein
MMHPQPISYKEWNKDNNSSLDCPGILLSIILCKSDSHKDNPFEWRISFSVPEKMLIYSWTHSQIICYALLKLLLKEVIKKNEKTDKLFCSYFLKTVIFWLSEELEQNVWTLISWLSWDPSVNHIVFRYKVIREISASYPINKAL